MSTAKERLEEDSKRWEVRAKKADVAYKVIISIIGSIVAAAFLVLQDRQTESRYYADLMAQRENADSSLRAEMFKVLFEAYFKNKIQADGQAPVARQSPAAAAALEEVAKIPDRFRQETILSDMLARNFDTIDVRPLLEDLDDRLAQQISANDGRGAAHPTPAQREAFLRRYQLRRVAVGATSRQAAALAGLSGKARASVTYHTIDTCDPEAQKKVSQKGLISLVQPPLPKEVGLYGGPIQVIRFRDGALDLQMTKLPKNDGPDSASTQGVSEINLSVAFFDMPALENIRLDNDSRVAFSLYKYFSRQDCARFRDDMDERLRGDCDYLLGSEVKDCAIAQFRTVILPKDFLGIHDRPYVTDLATGRYQAPWWKLW
jgi:hypothetical protein